MLRVNNGKNYTDSELANFEVIRPEKVSDRWKGIKHVDLVSCLERQMDFKGWSFQDRRISVDEKGSDMVGAWNLIIPEFEQMPDQTLSLGFIHSNNCKRSLRLVVGTEVFVCTNGLATGEVVLNKKHTVGLDLDFELDKALESYKVIAASIPDRVREMKERELSMSQVDHILMEAGRKKLVGFPILGEVSKEYLHPTFADNGSKTAWGLYNAFTYVIQKLVPRRQLDLLVDFREHMLQDVQVLSA